MDSYVFEEKKYYNNELEELYNEKSSITVLNEELESIFISESNIYEIKAELRSNGIEKNLLNMLSSDKLLNWFRAEKISENYSRCSMNNFCKLNVVNEHFISVFSKDNINSFDIKFSKKESEYIINGEVDLNKIYKVPIKQVNNISLYGKKNILKAVERGLYKRNNVAGDNLSMFAPEVERENLTYKRYI
jgi:hypothetical protein